MLKFQVDWTSTSSKTTSTKNFNMKRDENRRTKGWHDGRTDTQTRKHNAHKWGIKIYTIHKTKEKKNT